MKKFKVTSAHPLLKEGTILNREEAVFGSPALSITTSNGEPVHIAFLCDLQIEAHPTWYEEVKDARVGLSWMIDFKKDNGESDGYGGSIQLTEGEREELTQRVAALVRAYQDELINE